MCSAACRHAMPGALLCLASAAAFGAMGIFGKLAYDEGATVGHAAGRRASCSPPRSSGCCRLRPAARVSCGRCSAATSRSRSALGAVGYGAQAGGYFAALERLDASLLSLLVYTYPVLVTVAAIALGRERGEPPHGGGARAGVGRPRARARRRRRRGAGPARHRARARRGRRLQRLHPRLAGHRRAPRAARARHARVHRRGGHAHARRGRVRRPAPGRRQPGRASPGSAASPPCRPSARSGCSSPGCGASARRRPRSSRRSSRSSPSRSRSLVFGESLGPAQLAGGALVLLAVLAVRTQRSTKEAA